MPLALDFVASLARPGGSVTGSTFISEETIAKQFEFLKEAVPSLARVAVLVNPSNPVYGVLLEASEGPVRALHLRMQRLGVQSADDFDGVFDAAAREHADGLVVLRDTVIVMNMSRLLELAAKRRLPTMYGLREFVDAGGLMSYGPDLRDMYRRAAHVVARFSRAQKPVDLPVEQATQVRAGDQPQDRQGARPRNSANAARPRRRGDRMSAPGKAGAIQPVEVRPK